MIERLFSRWSLRARVFLAVSGAAFLPVGLMALSHWLEDVQQDRTDVELGAAIEEVSRAIESGRQNSVATLANRRSVRVRIVDLATHRTSLDVNRERNTRVPAAPFSWIYFPTDVPTLDQLDRTWPPLIERPEVRDAPTEGASMGCRSDPRGAVLVCHAARRIDDRVVYVQRGFVRGAVRAIYERNRELFRLVLVLLPVSLVLGYWLSRRMLRPLEALRNEALLRARAMDPSSPLSIERGDEIGDVKQALNTLLSAVAEQKLATEAFVADLAHEAKNPVASIRACAEALESDVSGERRERIAKNLRRSSDRLERLVSELLDLARVEAGMPRESHEEVDLAELARSLVAEVEADHPKLAFDVDAKDELYVRGVPIRLEAAVRNLLDNAASFAESRVTVRVRREREHAVLEVRDDGKGIDPELLPRVFDRFFTTRGSRAGTGLGLAMVRAVAQAHNGLARASSDASGACFELALPV